MSTASPGVFDIKVVVVPGNGRLIVAGATGESFLESAQIAARWAINALAEDKE